MWLININTDTLELHEFIDAAHAPPYAILSHCWGQSEISFKDFRKKRNRHGPGFEKIVKFCEAVRSIGYDGTPVNWAWVDTCCIDKRSSAELSEAINSMFHWYSSAVICYAYLVDVMREDICHEPGKEDYTALTASRWFSRGWTLQELLAPDEVLFLDSDWHQIGRKLGNLGGTTALAKAISSSTGISVTALLHFERLNQKATFSVAQRMSWASSRQTTRVEDEAYCLFGIFNIKIPLLYGEGRGAFRRLQTEIFRQELGDSIFAFKRPVMAPRPSTSYDAEVWNDVMVAPSLMAENPSAFAGGGGAYADEQATHASIIQPRGRGFEVRIPKSPQNMVHRHRTEPRLLVALGCLRCEEGGEPERCVLLLERAACGHFNVKPAAFGWTVWCQNELNDPSQYRPVQAAGTVFVHGARIDAVYCERDGTNAAPGVVLPCSLVHADPKQAHGDAVTFGIR